MAWDGEPQARQIEARYGNSSVSIPGSMSGARFFVLKIMCNRMLAKDWGIGRAAVIPPLQGFSILRVSPTH
jgi:hypothetical protein